MGVPAASEETSSSVRRRSEVGNGHSTPDSDQCPLIASGDADDESDDGVEIL